MFPGGGGVDIVTEEVAVQDATEKAAFLLLWSGGCGGFKNCGGWGS